MRPRVGASVKLPGAMACGTIHALAIVYLSKIQQVVGWLSEKESSAH